jgi:hypothetical protein
MDAAVATERTDFIVNPPCARRFISSSDHNNQARRGVGRTDYDLDPIWWTV